MSMCVDVCLDMSLYVCKGREEGGKFERLIEIIKWREGG